MINRTAVALVALWAGLLCTQAVACLPDCPPCYGGTWPDCEWDCSSGQDCCDNVCCSGTCCGPWNSCCPSTHCQGCLNGQCQSTCKSADCETCISHTCKVCEGDTSKTCCNGDCCSSNQCCTNSGCVYCDGDDKCCLSDGSGCATLDLDWKDTSGMTVVVDPALVSALSDAVGQIPGMPSVSFSSMVLAYSEQEKECCSDGEIKKIKCASGIGAIGASIQRVSLWSVDESYRLEWLGFGVKLTIEAEAYIEGTVGATCSIGKYENECTEESCNFGKISAIAGIEIGTSCWVEGCVILFGHDLCMNFGAELSAAIEFEGSVRLNKCGSCDGLEGSFSLKTLKLKLRFWSDGQSDEDEINLLE